MLLPHVNNASRHKSDAYVIEIDRSLSVAIQAGRDHTACPAATNLDMTEPYHPSEEVANSVTATCLKKVRYLRA